jgi:hypothetical protein
VYAREYCDGLPQDPLKEQMGQLEDADVIRSALEVAATHAIASQQSPAEFIRTNQFVLLNDETLVVLRPSQRLVRQLEFAPIHKQQYLCVPVTGFLGMYKDVVDAYGSVGKKIRFMADQTQLDPDHVPVEIPNTPNRNVIDSDETGPWDGVDHDNDPVEPPEQYRVSQRSSNLPLRMVWHEGNE